MIRIWRVDSTSRVYIYGVTEGPASSFSAVANGDYISISRSSIGIMEIGNALYSTLGDQSGTAFTSAAQAMNYFASIFQDTDQSSSSSIKKYFTASTSMQAFRLFYVAGNNDQAALCDFAYADRSLPIGLTLKASNAGEPFEGLLFGEIRDSSFNFQLNAPLYLGSQGAITDTQAGQPMGSTTTTIGYSLGAGAIFLNIETVSNFNNDILDGGNF